LPSLRSYYKLLAMKLIITEKNQTARRIATILSAGSAKREGTARSPIYTFKEGSSSVKCIGLRGHILKVDFPDEYLKWQDVEPRTLVRAELVKTPTDSSLVTTLKRLAKEASEIVIATDYDREGELIALDIERLCREVNQKAKYFRARFSALTPADVKNSFSNLTSLDENLARAGEARQDIDLIWGATLTRFISLATTRLGRKFLSVGRVQSPTLALIVEREKEIQSFVPEDYWVLTVTFEKDGETFTARHKKEKFSTFEEAKEHMDKVEDAGRVVEVVQKEREINPPPPFNTTMFLTASSSLRISPARAMNIAESLYSRGYISYPRVDNTVYPDSLSLKGILKTLTGADVIGPLASEILIQPALKPTRGKKISTDHPPIHPTSKALKSELRDVEWKIYELVSRRFLATLSSAAKARSTKVTVDCSGEEFVARGDVIVDEGFLKFYPYGRKKDEELPTLREGEILKVVDKKIEKKQTQPPNRYTEGKLIEKMESMGLGTKSTRHTIIQNLIERGYIYGNPLRPSETGMAVSSALKRHATPVTTPEMTSQLERDMDEIAEGKKTLDSVVDTSREILDGVLDLMEGEKESITREIKEGLRGDTVLGACPSCGGELRVRISKQSGKRFAGCSNYPECNKTYPLPQKGGVIGTGEICEECGSPRVRIIAKGRKPWETCLEPNCPSKAETAKQGAKRAGGKVKKGKG